MHNKNLKLWVKHFLCRLSWVLVITLYSFQSVQAAVSIELTRGIKGAIPITVLPFEGEAVLSNDQKISEIIAADLAASGRFKIIQLNQNVKGSKPLTMRIRRRQSADYRISGTIESLTSDLEQVSFQLTDTFGNNNVSLTERYHINEADIRRLAHHISDAIYKELTGEQGIFSTRIAYVVKQEQADEPTRYLLAVADYDGYQPQTLLVSPAILMSPAWSPDGKDLAYVTFENNQAQISTINIATGEQSLITEYPGINSSPTYSPDGKTLAVVLSKDGNPKIYTIDLQTKQLHALTKGSTIDTEPNWLPDGKSILFTSDRGSTPQIYRYDFNTHRSIRLTFDGGFNASPIYTPDEQHIVMLHQTRDGRYNIAVQDLQTGDLMPLTYLGFADAPSVAPNGQMVIYSVLESDQRVLRIISIDGAMSTRLATISGDATYPAWSPVIAVS